MRLNAACSRFTASCWLILAAAFFLCAPVAWGQQKNQAQPNMQQSAASLTVNVRLPDGSPIDHSVVVNLYSFTGGFAGIAWMRAGQAEFGTLPVGRYTVEVIAPGYQKLTQQVEVSFGGQHELVYVTLVPASH